jgi:predicted transcriptional regulator YdeE
MTVTEVTLETIHLVGIEVVGRIEELQRHVPAAWQRLTERAGEIPHRVENGLFYGVVPDAMHTSSEADVVYSYTVGAPVERFGQAIPEGLVTLTIPAQRYAQATVRGGAEVIDETYIALGRWMGENGRAPDASALGFERYDVRRQRPTPPYDTFDYDVLRPLAAS